MLPSASSPDNSALSLWKLGRWLWSSSVSFWDRYSTTFAQICRLTAVLGSTGILSTPSLSDVCTPDYIRTVLPHSLDLGITIDPASISVRVVTNASYPVSSFNPGGTIDYCDVVLAYSHDDRVDDRVLVQYWLPAPASFQNRYVSTGGDGLRINAGKLSLPLGPLHGAVSGRTDGGFGGFKKSFDLAVSLPDGTVNQYILQMFAYQAIYELTAIGKQFTQQFFQMSDRKLYAYFEGCSEGGREGWSQIQRYESQFDGLVTGAPAFRFSHQQVQQLWSNVLEQKMGYYPPFCEMEKIWEETIFACDALDGRMDGVVARSELCQEHFDFDTVIGVPYYCPAQNRTVPAPFFDSLDLPTQEGVVTAEAVAVARAASQGAHNEKGQRLYFSYQLGSSYMSGITKFNYTTNSYQMHVNGMAGVFVSRLLMFHNSSILENLDGATFDTLQEWIIQGWEMYADTLQTTMPDLTPFRNAGAKVLMYHGEADDSIPAASSVRYWESVRSVMYPKMSYNDSVAALNNWFRLYLVPGADHCGMSEHAHKNAPWPVTKLAVLIDWVEKGIVPTRLNATHLTGAYTGQDTEICGWPLRPLWTENGTRMNCVYDQKSIDSWQYTLDAFDVPVY